MRLHRARARTPHRGYRQCVNGAPADAILWLEPSQAELAASVCEHAGLRPVSVGFPAGQPAAQPATGSAGALAQARVFRDVRHRLAEGAGEVVLVFSRLGDQGSRPGTAPSVLDDPGLLADCRKRGMSLFSLEPCPGSLHDLAAGTDIWEPAGEARIGMVPLLRRSAVFLEAREALAVIGPVRTMLVSMRSAPGSGSLAARLVDAMAVVHAMLGVPESVDCTLVPPGSVGGIHPAPPELLTSLRGDLTANLRFGGSDGPRAASLSLSDRGPEWFRGVTVIGQNGGLRLTDAETQLLGNPAEAAGAEPPASAPRRRADASRVIAEAIRRERDQRLLFEPIDWAGVLSMCEAALLSARTGQGESPSMMLRMSGVGG